MHVFWCYYVDAMNINFPPVDDNFIKDRIASGYYGNATELVRDAVRRLREGTETKRERLLAALQLGEEQIARGEMVRYTPELLDEITERAMERAKKGEKPNPDVTPT